MVSISNNFNTFSLLVVLVACLTQVSSSPMPAPGGNRNSGTPPTRSEWSDSKSSSLRKSFVRKLSFSGSSKSPKRPEQEDTYVGRHNWGYTDENGNWVSTAALGQPPASTEKVYAEGERRPHEIDVPRMDQMEHFQNVWAGKSSQ